MTDKPISLPRVLVADVARQTGVTRERAREIITAALTHIRAAAATHPVRVQHFGTFYTQTRRGGTRPHPRNPALTVTVPNLHRLALRAAYEEMSAEQGAATFIPEQELA